MSLSQSEMKQQQDNFNKLLKKIYTKNESIPQKLQQANQQMLGNNFDDRINLIGTVCYNNLKLA